MSPRFRSTIRQLLGLFLLCCQGCALLRPAPTQTFVSEGELDAVSMTREGLGYLQTGRFIDAQLSFYQVLSKYPGSENVLIALGAAQVGNGDGAGAVTTLEPIYRKNPLNYRVTDLMVNALVLEGRDREAIDLLEKALSGSADIGELAGIELYGRLLAEQYFRLGFEQAASCYSELAYQAQKSPNEAVRHARMLLARGYAEASLALLNPVPTIPSPPVEQGRLTTLALASFALEHFDEAQRYGTGAVAAASQEADVEAKLVSLLSLQKRREAESQKAAASATAAAKNDDTSASSKADEVPLVLIYRESDDAADAGGKAKLVLTARQLELLPKLVWPPNFFDAVDKIPRIESVPLLRLPW